MADKKPEAKKPAGGSSSGSNGHMFELEAKIVAVIAFIIILYFAFGRFVLEALGYGQDSLLTSLYKFLNQGLDVSNTLFNTIVFFSIFLILVFILGSIYIEHKHKEIVTLYKIALPKGHLASLSSTAKVGGDSSNNADGKTGGATSTATDTDTKPKPVLNFSGENKKWEDIQKHMASMNVSDWKMAILEADILLYEMLDQMGYDGETVADKLNNVEASDFNTIESAWRAHKIRNIIAHEGSSYVLSYHQAQNTIDLYRKVFQEFYFI